MKKFWKLIINFFKKLFGIKIEEEEVNIEPTVPSTEDSGTTVIESGDTEVECPQIKIIPIADSENKLKITFIAKEEK